MKRFCTCLAAALLICAVASCRTVNFDKTTDIAPEKKTKGINNKKQEEQADRKKMLEYEIEEELKEVDLERTVIYVDRPVYSPVEKPEPQLSGGDAVVQSNRNSLQIPTRFVNGIMYYAWDDSFVYEIHTTPYRTTDFMLEPGEQVLEMPFLSEEKVWEIGAGVSVEKGQDVQHFFIKPAYSNLATSMIIITNRRVYHLLLKSFRNPPSSGGPERYMPIVKFNYPPSMPFVIKSDKLQKQMDDLNNLGFGTNLVDPRFLSFDYKMSYSIFKKPVWLPQRVYDDGRKTYIIMDRRMLHTESPVLFNQRNHRINYRVHENMIVIDELIEKVTIRRGKDKVTIVKKMFKNKNKQPQEEQP